MKKSIVIFTNTLLSGGAEKQAVLLAQSMKYDYHVLLVVYYGNKVESKFADLVNDAQLRVVLLKGSHFKKIAAFYHILKSNKVWGIFSYLLTTNLIGAVVGKLARVPVRVGGIRNAVLDKKKLPVQRFINNHLSTHTIFNNYNGLLHLKKEGFNPANATVIPNCFELSTQMIERQNDPVTNIITVGRFVQQKGYFEALKIMQALKKDGIKFKYFIIGFGEMEADIRQRVMETGLSDVVEIVINPPNINNYYQLSDIYLCTSYFEGLSNTVMEALSFSLPVVATTAGDNDQLVINGVNGFLINECKYNLFIDPLKKLINSAQLRNSMGKESYRLIKDNYSADAFKANYEAFISQSSLQLNLQP